jgi:hypothetical protein
MRTSNENHLAALYRVSFGLLTLFALVVQYLTAQAHPPFNRLNFFSYFTTLGNLLGAVVFLRVGLGTRRTLSVEWMRGAATLYLSVVFVLFAALLTWLGDYLLKQRTPIASKSEK